MNKHCTVVRAWLFWVPICTWAGGQQAGIPAEVAAEVTAVEELDATLTKVAAPTVSDKARDRKARSMKQPQAKTQNRNAAHPAPEIVPAAAATPVSTNHRLFGTVYRKAFTSAINDREPVDRLETIADPAAPIYFFTDLRGFTGQVITHQWWYGGQLMAEVHFKVKGPRWRVWSSKKILPSWTGQWRVTVVDSSGEIIDEGVLQHETRDNTGSTDSRSL